MSSQKEEDEVPAFRSTTYLLAQVSNLIRTSWIDPALKKYGITSLQYTILAVINRYSGLSSAELSRHFFVTPQTMGPILAQLEKRNLLVRDENQENRRLLSISLTPAGKSLLVKCNEEIQEIESIIFREFNEKSLDDLRGYMKGLYARCKEQRR